MDEFPSPNKPSGKVLSFEEAKSRRNTTPEPTPRPTVPSGGHPLGGLNRTPTDLDTIYHRRTLREAQKKQHATSARPTLRLVTPETAAEIAKTTPEKFGAKRILEGSGMTEHNAAETIQPTLSPLSESEIAALRALTEPIPDAPGTSDTDNAAFRPTSTEPSPKETHEVPTPKYTGLRKFLDYLFPEK